MAPDRQEAEEAATRIEKRLRDYRLGDHESRGSIPRLLLEILAEELKIHRLHLEERAREARMQEQGKHGKQGGKRNEERGRRRLRKHHDKETGRARSEQNENGHQHHESRETGRARSEQNENGHQHHESRETERARSAHAGDVSADDELHTMSGGAGPTGSQTSNSQPDEPAQDRKRGKRGRRSSPIPDPPSYHPKLGLTMGFGSHVRECIKHEAARLEKEAKRKERRKRGPLEERREAARKRKPSERLRSESRGGDRTRSPGREDRPDDPLRSPSISSMRPGQSSGR